MQSGEGQVFNWASRTVQGVGKEPLCGIGRSMPGMAEMGDHYSMGLQAMCELMSRDKRHGWTE